MISSSLIIANDNLFFQNIALSGGVIYSNNSIVNINYYNIFNQNFGIKYKLKISYLQWRIILFL